MNAWKPPTGIVQEQLTSPPIEEVYALEPEPAPLVESPCRCISTPASRRDRALYPSLRTPIRSCLRPGSYLHHRVPLLRSRLCNCLPLPITPTTTPRGNQSLAQLRLNSLICPQAIIPLPVNIGGLNQRLCFPFPPLLPLHLPLQRFLILLLHLSLLHTPIVVYHGRRAIVRSTTRHLCSKTHILKSTQWLKLPHSVHSQL